MDAKILIVDDEPAIRKLLARYLQEEGYDCQFAETVANAKEILASNTFDLLLSDLKMPGESGLDLVRHAKKHYPQMGRIMITGYGSPEIASEIMMVGVYGYIIKPITKNIVLISVENALRHLRLDLHMQACKVELEKNVSDHRRGGFVSGSEIKNGKGELKMNAFVVWPGMQITKEDLICLGAPGNQPLDRVIQRVRLSWD